MISLFDSCQHNLIFHIPINAVLFLGGGGEIPRVSQREVNATLSAVRRRDRAQDEKGNLSWILASESSVICFSQ